MAEIGWSRKTVQTLVSRNLEQRLRGKIPSIDMDEVQQLRGQLTPIFTAIVDTSRHLGEDHERDSLHVMFFNRALIDLKRKARRDGDKKAEAVADMRLASVLGHEMVHEITGEGMDFEDELAREDQEILKKDLKEAGLSFSDYLDVLVPEIFGESYVLEEMKATHSRRRNQYPFSTRHGFSNKNDHGGFFK